MSKIATTVARKALGSQAQAYEAQDPLYEQYTNSKGKVKRRRRGVPEGLSEHDARVLKKVRKRAHYLDKGISLCGLRVGWTFWIGLIPLAGDIADAALGYNLVIKPAKTCDLPGSLESRMLFNQMLASGVGLVPLVGDIIYATIKPNSRNAWLLEQFLIERALQATADPEAQAAAVVKKSKGWTWSKKTGDPIPAGISQPAPVASAQPVAGGPVARPQPAAVSPAKPVR